LCFNTYLTINKALSLKLCTKKMFFCGKVTLVSGQTNQKSWRQNTLGVLSTPTGQVTYIISLNFHEVLVSWMLLCIFARLHLLMQAISVELGLGVVMHVFRCHVVEASKLVHAHHMSWVLVSQCRMHLMHWHGIHTGHLVFLLPLHPTVLKPDLDLSLCQAKCMGNFNPSPPCQVSVKMELFLQLEGLVSGIRGPLALCLAILIYRICKKMQEFYSWKD